MWTSTEHDRDARQSRDLVCDVRANGRGHLGEIEPVLDDDPKGDGEPVRRAHDLDAALGTVARDERAEPATSRRRADDAVALGRRPAAACAIAAVAIVDLALHGLAALSSATRGG